MYLADIENEAFDYKELYTIMPDTRQEKSDRFKFMADKKRSILVWWLLVRAYGDLAGLDYKFLGENIDVTLTGKPCFKEDIEASVPGGLRFFNLAHSGSKVICAVSSYEVGCDVEMKCCDGLKIAKRFFHEKEFEYLKSIRTKEQQDKEFLRLWTMKEAFVKATGEGIAMPFNEIAFVGSDNELLDKVERGGESFLFRECFAGEDYSCHVCIKITGVI